MCYKTVRKNGKQELLHSFEFSKIVISKFSGRLLVGQNDLPIKKCLCEIK